MVPAAVGDRGERRDARRPARREPSGGRREGVLHRAHRGVLRPRPHAGGDLLQGPPRTFRRRAGLRGRCRLREGDGASPGFGHLPDALRLPEERRRLAHQDAEEVERRDPCGRRRPRQDVLGAGGHQAFPEQRLPDAPPVPEEAGAELDAVPSQAGVKVRRRRVRLRGQVPHGPAGRPHGGRPRQALLAPEAAEAPRRGRRKPQPAQRQVRALPDAPGQDSRQGRLGQGARREGAAPFRHPDQQRPPRHPQPVQAHRARRQRGVRQRGLPGRGPRPALPGREQAVQRMVPEGRPHNRGLLRHPAVQLLQPHRQADRGADAAHGREYAGRGPRLSKEAQAGERVRRPRRPRRLPRRHGRLRGPAEDEPHGLPADAVHGGRRRAGREGEGLAGQRLPREVPREDDGRPLHEAAGELLALVHDDGREGAGRPGSGRSATRRGARPSGRSTRTGRRCWTRRSTSSSRRTA